MHFNRIDLNGIFRITDIEGRGPFMQEILRQSIAGRDGSYRIDRRIPERPLNVEGRILAKSKEDLRDKINYLNTILYTNDAVAIVFSDEPNVTYYGEYAGTPGWEEKRSEEHTSELQSRGHLVCRLLLEKKKKR